MEDHSYDRKTCHRLAQFRRELLLINDVTVVFNAMTDNVDIYANPDPPLAEIKLDLENYTTAVYLPIPARRTPSTKTISAWC